MKQFRIPFAVLTMLALSSGCMPKKASSTGGSTGSTSSSPVSGNGGGLIGTTPTPFATTTITGNPIIKVQNIIKRQPNVSTPTQANSIWVSTSEPSIGNGTAFTTDKYFKYRIKVNAQPAWANCGPWTAQSHTQFNYQKLKMKVTVTNDTTGYVCNTNVLGPIDVGTTSAATEVLASCLTSAVKPIVQIDSVTSDNNCQSCKSSQWNNPPYAPANYCDAYGCPATLPDPTQCWSVDLEVATSNTTGF